MLLLDHLHKWGSEHALPHPHHFIVVDRVSHCVVFHQSDQLVVRLSLFVWKHVAKKLFEVRLQYGICHLAFCLLVYLFALTQKGRGDDMLVVVHIFRQYAFEYFQKNIAVNDGRVLLECVYGVVRGLRQHLLQAELRFEVGEEEGIKLLCLSLFCVCLGFGQPKFGQKLLHLFQAVRTKAHLPAQSQKGGHIRPEPLSDKVLAIF
mmetsp:Transcript_10821/g.28403  ORF Transcript_10821/g.28403 Transcript_10821/m.28403 type:complete len:205 (+) Transcript_10821:781-1395(+)